jgi:hypothetical protein
MLFIPSRLNPSAAPKIALSQRGVFLTRSLPNSEQKAFSYFKCTSIFSNILAHQHEVGIFLHTLMQALFDGIDETIWS